MKQIHSTAVIEEGVIIQEGVVIGPHCFVDAGAVIGEGTILEANVVDECSSLAVLVQNEATAIGRFAAARVGTRGVDGIERNRLPHDVR